MYSICIAYIAYSMYYSAIVYGTTSCISYPLYIIIRELIYIYISSCALGSYGSLVLPIDLFCLMLYSSRVKGWASTSQAIQSSQTPRALIPLEAARFELKHEFLKRQKLPKRPLRMAKQPLLLHFCVPKGLCLCMAGSCGHHCSAPSFLAIVHWFHSDHVFK